MKKKYLKIIMASVVLVSMNLAQIPAFAATTKTDKLGEGNIVVANNVGKADTINVDNVTEGTVIRIYKTATAATAIAATTVAKGKIDAALSITQLGSEAGSIYVTVTNPGCTESDRTEGHYDAEVKTVEIGDGNIVALNNGGMADTVYVYNVTEGAVIKVYKTETNGTAIATKTVVKGETKATLSIPQLGSEAGSIYVTATNPGFAESNRTQCHYDAEVKTVQPSEGAIIVTNNAGKADTINVVTDTEGSIIKVYKTATAGTAIATTTVAKGKIDATLSVAQLGSEAGTIYVTVTVPGCAESDRTKYYYNAEVKTAEIGEGNIAVTNSAGKADTIYVAGVVEGAVIKVYKTATAGAAIATTTVAKGKIDATLSVPQLGSGAGSIFVTVTNPGCLESDKTECHYYGEVKTDQLGEGNIVITNNAGKADTIYAAGVVEGAVIKVYKTATAGVAIATTTVAKGKIDATLSVAQLGSEAGSIYVTVTNPGCTESDRIECDYGPELKSEQLVEDRITLINNIEICNSQGYVISSNDIVKVTNLEPGDVIKAYAGDSCMIGKAVVAKGSTEGVIKTTFIRASGYLSITVTKVGKLESDPVNVEYLPEPWTDVPEKDNIVISNNVNKADTVKVMGLKENDIVKVYRNKTTESPLGTSVVAKGKNEATVTIPQLGQSSGVVIITVKSPGKNEARLLMQYDAEVKTDQLGEGNIVISNNVGKADTINVDNVTEGTVIRIYKTATARTAIAATTVAKGKIDATLNVPQLGSEAGSIFVTVTNPGCLESDKTECHYYAEVKTAQLGAGNIVITNNAGKVDTINVDNVTEGAVIKVYRTAIAGTAIATTTVAKGKIDATLSVAQLGSAAGSIFVTVTNPGCLESDRTECNYEAEAKTDTLHESNISYIRCAEIFDNNRKVIKTNDCIKVSDLEEGDVVKLYIGNCLVGKTIVYKDKKEAILYNTMLPDPFDGYLSITLTKVGKLESDPVNIRYSSQTYIKPFNEENIIITNNVGKADTVKISGLNPNDTVRVYSKNFGEGDSVLIGYSLLASAVVHEGESEATVNIAQLGKISGYVYILIRHDNNLYSILKCYEGEKN